MYAEMYHIIKGFYISLYVLYASFLTLTTKKIGSYLYTKNIA